MAEFLKRRQGERRRARIRSGVDRRNPDLPRMLGSTRSGNDRRRQDRRTGMDRRKG